MVTVPVDVLTRHRLGLLDLEACAVADGRQAERLACVYRAFLARVPFETVSHRLSCREAPGEPEAWPRTTDRFLRENRAHGLGGTSFSLAYALRDLFRGLGANAHCTLGRNLVTEEAHAAVVVYGEEEPLLYDPSLLLAGPVPVRPGGTLEDPLGVVRLKPCSGATLTLTISMRCAGHERRVYDLVPAPAPPHAFRQAWVASFWRGRSRPLWIARRVGEEIRRYGERPGSLEVLRADCRSHVRLPASPVQALREAFGIDAATLAEAFREADAS